jgi:hypothetical protein
MSVTLTIAKQKKGAKYVLQAIDSSNRTVVAASGHSPKDAAEWLIRAINRRLVDIEQAIIDLGLLTDAEIEVIGDEESEDPFPLLTEPT